MRFLFDMLASMCNIAYMPDIKTGVDVIWIKGQSLICDHKYNF